MIKSGNRAWDNIGIYVFFVFTFFALLYPVIFTREATFCKTGDNIHQAYPWLNKLCVSLHKGYLPVWDANTFGGRNFSGEFQTGIFYPLNILWCWMFGSVNGISVYYLDLLVSLHYLICVIGMYQVGRVFRLPMIPSAVSALVFTFTGALSGRSGCETCIFFGLALMPWSIYFLGKYYQVHRHKKYLIFSGLIAGLEILAGHIQPFFHTILISATIVLLFEYQRRSSWKQFTLSLITTLTVIIVCSIIISLPQIYYAAEYLSHCYRESGDGIFMSMKQKIPLETFTHRFVISLSNLTNLINKDYNTPQDYNIIYMGVIPLFLLVIFLIKRKALKMTNEHTNLAKMAGIILLIGILVVIGYVTFLPYLLYTIPLLNGVRELSRYIVLISFGASLLVGLSLAYIEQWRDIIFQPSAKTRNYVLLLLLAINCFYLVLFQEKDISMSVSIPFLFCFLFFLVLISLESIFYIPVLALVLIFSDLYLNPVNYGTTQTFFYPSNLYARDKLMNYLETTYGKYRVTLDMREFALLKRNLGDVYNIQTKWGFGATVNEPYYEFIHFNGIKSADADDLLNIKYVITDKTLDSNFIFRDSTVDLKLYERKNYYPRCYWKRQLGMQGKEIEAENKEAIQQLAYSDLYQKISVNCSVSDTLIFSENYYPGWACFDNDKKIPIYKATIKNYPPLFRSIALDKGRHIIEFKYNKVFHWF